MKIVEIVSDKLRNAAFQMEGLKGLSICEGEQIAIVGANGAGKSRLVGILTSRYPMMQGDGVRYDFVERDRAATSRKIYQNIKEINFRDSYGAGDDSEYYHQQRWNSFDVAGRRRVCDELEPLAQGCREGFRDKLYSQFNIDAILDKELILLSSGEMRKFQLTKALLSTPKVLIIDNPFIGLDAPSRAMLTELLADIVAQGGTQLVLVVSRSEDIPPFVTHIIPVEGLKCGEKLRREDYHPSEVERDCRASVAMIEALPDDSTYGGLAVEMHDVGIKYGVREILRGVDFTIRKGERWVITGRNGAGKSTLLSLICADNPQSYRCNISLFGRKRGSGESIWDIKRRIGYISPEMHRSFSVSMPVIDIVASGLFDSIGLWNKIGEEQREKARLWISIFQIEELASRNFMTLSSGEQRVVLLARAFVKQPELLILDEPLHGLDESFRSLAVAIIDAYSSKVNRTSILVTHYIDELPFKDIKRHTL